MSLNYSSPCHALNGGFMSTAVEGRAWEIDNILKKTMRVISYPCHNLICIDGFHITLQTSGIPLKIEETLNAIEWSSIYIVIIINDVSL